jgi:hypothetical protein
MCAANIPGKTGCFSKKELGEKISSTLRSEPWLPTEGNDSPPVITTNAGTRNPLSQVQNREELASVTRDLDRFWSGFDPKKNCDPANAEIERRKKAGKWVPSGMGQSPLQASVLVEILSKFSDPAMKIQARVCLKQYGLKELMFFGTHCYGTLGATLGTATDLTKALVEDMPKNTDWGRVAANQMNCIKQAVARLEQQSNGTGESALNANLNDSRVNQSVFSRRSSPTLEADPSSTAKAKSADVGK